jgi:2-polyprenyl-3-methyl-5-hydroxy-6-metoxy-1,4-benzoquinol methylase
MMAERQPASRFEFGKNWQRYIDQLDEDRIVQAEQSLKDLLGVETLKGQSFLDIGSGSGLFSLSAVRLGVAQIHSFDYDSASVACTQSLKVRFFSDATNWMIEKGDILDPAYFSTTGQWDIVYSWGVLHHTGKMWQALKNASTLVKPGGKLVIAIYNDQGWPSQAWLVVKKLYNWLPAGLRFLVLWPSALRLWGPSTIRDFLRGRPFATWRDYEQLRGMSPWVDVVDWVGGYPFEVATVAQIEEFYNDLGFKQVNLIRDAGRGCNQFVFVAGG